MKKNILILPIFLCFCSDCVFAGGAKRPTVSVNVTPACKFDLMTVEVPTNKDFNYICNQDYRGKGHVYVRADAHGNPVVTYEPIGEGEWAQVGKTTIQQKKSANAIGDQEVLPNIPAAKDFIDLGTITAPKNIDQLILPTSKDKPYVGYRYKSSTGDLSDATIFILFRYVQEAGQVYTKVSRATGRAVVSNKTIWTVFMEAAWPTDQVIAEGTKVTVLPSGHCEVLLPGNDTSLVLPLGNKSMHFDSSEVVKAQEVQPSTTGK